VPGQREVRDISFQHEVEEERTPGFHTARQPDQVVLAVQ
jgi:hypothetical protein